MRTLIKFIVGLLLCIFLIFFDIIFPGEYAVDEFMQEQAPQQELPLFTQGDNLVGR